MNQKGVNEKSISPRVVLLSLEMLVSCSWSCRVQFGLTERVAVARVTKFPVCQDDPVTFRWSEIIDNNLWLVV